MDERHWVFVCDNLLRGVPDHSAVVLLIFRVVMGTVVIVVVIGIMIANAITGIAMVLGVVGISSHEVL